MNTTTQAAPVTDSLYASEAKRGLRIELSPIRPAAPVIAFDTKTPTQVDPTSFPICPCGCGVWAVDCPGNAS